MMMSKRCLRTRRRHMSTIRILAIDPGYDRVGIAVIDKHQQDRETLVYSSCIRTNAKEAFVERLAQIGSGVEQVISEYAPTVFAIENLFLANNQKTAMRVAEARGALLYIAQQHTLSIYEYTPLQIKAAITGDGKSPKDRLMYMLPKLITILHPITYDDEWDAIAIGLTCSAHTRGY